jgi:hypothetical protein
VVKLPEGYRKRLENDATATNDCPDEEDFNDDEEEDEFDPVFTS